MAGDRGKRVNRHRLGRLGRSHRLVWNLAGTSTRWLVSQACSRPASFRSVSNDLLLDRRLSYITARTLA